MFQPLGDPVSVILTYNHKTALAMPRSIEWGSRIYPILKLGLHHTYRRGKTLFHVFSVTSDGLFFRLELNTDSLHWELKEVSDGLPD